VPTPCWPNLWQEISDVRAFNQDVWASGITSPHIQLGATWEWMSNCTRPSTWCIAGWVDPTVSVDAFFRESQNSVFTGVESWAHWLTQQNKFKSMFYSSVSQTVFFSDPFWLRNVTTDHHILPHVIRVCTVDGYSKVDFLSHLF